MEGAPLTKEALIQIIEHLDQALEILKKEFEERDDDGEGASTLARCTEEMGHLTRHLESDYDDYNGWAERRAQKSWGGPLEQLFHGNAIVHQQRRHDVPCVPLHIHRGGVGLVSPVRGRTYRLL
ncbi:unnamed protein product [Linum trigynum]|uniref:Rx N-terminal domain-containing protein n=1 Tax=Linum trigynum TaxID=586398 RepID=A0AAV2DXX8_9ROSI